MATITNRSPYVVRVSGSPDKTFKSKKEALAYQESLGKKCKLEQLDTYFQVQIRLKDKDGNLVCSSKAFTNLADAKKWASQEDGRLEKHRERYGSFNMTLETAQMLPSLNKVIEEYYDGKASQETQAYLVPTMAKFFGEATLIKDITPAQCKAFRDGLKNADYAPSTIRSNFALLNALYKHAKSEWLLDIENPAKGIRLSKEVNAVQRYWKNKEEKELLLGTIKKNSPWLLPIVHLSLNLSFRRGELLAKTLKGKNAHKYVNDGLMWENISFSGNAKGEKYIKLIKEKNDWKKSATQPKGRVLPMTKQADEILMELWLKQGKPTHGRVFNHSGNSASHAFKRCCDIAGIKRLSLHSMRKVAIVDISRVAPNPIILSRFSGHRDLSVLASTYYDLPLADLQVYADQLSLKDYRLRALLAIEKMVGIQSTIDFLNFVKSTDIINREKIVDELKNATTKPNEPVVRIINGKSEDVEKPTPNKKYING